MFRSVLIVDDFLDNAEGLRQHALTLDYPDLQGAFPGRNSLQRINIDGLDQIVSHLAGEPLVAIDPPESHAKCRITLASDVGRGKVHVDHSDWSGILYLSKPEDCRGGTQFFRHKRTNTSRAAITEAELAAMGYASVADMHRDIIERDGNDESAWDMTMEVPMEFNRLILLRPWLWHTAGPGFGDRIDTGRLVYLMFFKRQV
jgi:hypothetical protein